MLDLSPEKLFMLLTLGVIVLGPNKLPSAARGLAQSLARVRRLAASLTDPLAGALEEPRRVAAGLTDPFKAALEQPRQAAAGLTDPFKAALEQPRQAAGEATASIHQVVDEVHP